MSAIDTIDFDVLSAAIGREDGTVIDVENIAEVAAGAPRGGPIHPRSSRKLVTYKGGCYPLDREANALHAQYDAGLTAQAMFFSPDSVRAEDYHDTLIAGLPFAVHNVDKESGRLQISSHELLMEPGRILLPAIVAVKFTYDANHRPQMFSRVVALTGAELEPINWGPTQEPELKTYEPYVSETNPAPLQ